MEKITMEFLLRDFMSVVDGFNQLVANKDIEGVKKALAEIGELISNKEKVQLDHPEHENADHVLHDLLKNIGGYIERVNIREGKDVKSVEIIDIYKKWYEELKIEETLILKEISSIKNKKHVINENEGNKALREELEEQQKNRKNRKERIAELNRILEPKSSTNVDKEKLTKELEYQKRKLRKAEELYDEFKNPNEYTPEDNDPRRMDSVKQRVHEANLKKEIEDIKNEIANIENQLEQPDKANNIDDSRSDAGEQNNPDISEADKERLTILQNRLVIVRETKERIRALSVQKTKIPGEKKVEGFDVTKAVKELGDKIFKTAEIRRELSQRNVTREEFLDYYRQGRNVAEINLEQLKNEQNELVRTLMQLTQKIGENGEYVNIYKEAHEALNDNRDTELIKNAEELRNKCIGHLEGIPETEIKTKEEAESLMEIVSAFVTDQVERITNLNDSIKDQKENISIFDREINILEKEIDIEKYSLDKIVEDAEKEKALRNKVIEATMDGKNSRLIEEWNDRISRLCSHKKTLKETYIDENGDPKEVEFETIEEYPEYKEDAYFLNLSKFKQYLELSSKYENSNGDVYALGDEALKFVELIKSRGGEPKEFFDKMSEEWKSYVDTFHGYANDYQIKHENLKTSGSTLKSMIHVKNLSPIQKTGAVAENIFRFFGIRKPEFTKVNSEGETVRDVRGGLTTIGIDAAVVGGVTGATIIGGIPALTAIGVGYAAKGVVTAANVIRGAAFKKKYKDEIEAGVPILRGATEEEKMVARKDYYNTVEDRTRFGSWARAWNDRFFRRKRADETEEKIVDLRKGESNDFIDIKTRELAHTYNENKKKSNQNHEARQTNYREEAKSAYTYNEVVADPDSIDMQETVARTAQNAVASNKRRINFNTSELVNDKYEKAPWERLETEDLDRIERDDDSISNTSLTREQRYTADMQRRDRINKIWTMILTTAGNLGIEAIKNGLTKEVDLPDKTVKTTEQQPMYEDVVEEKIPSKMGDFKLKADGLDNTYTGDTTGIPNDIISTGNSSTMSDPVAVSIQYTNASGEEIVMSMAEKGLGYTQKHVQSLVDFDISSMTPAELVSKFAEHNPNYGNMIQAMGLQGKSAEEIAKVFIEKGMVHLQDKTMNGWQQIAESNLTRMVSKVLKGSKDVALSKIVDGGTKTVIDYERILESLGIGVGVGAGINLADILHEANKQTKKKRPGTYEQNIDAIRREDDTEPSYY